MLGGIGNVRKGVKRYELGSLRQRLPPRLNVPPEDGHRLPAVRRHLLKAPSPAKDFISKGVDSTVQVKVKLELQGRLMLRRSRVQPEEGARDVILPEDEEIHVVAGVESGEELGQDEAGGWGGGMGGEGGFGEEGCWRFGRFLLVDGFGGSGEETIGAGERWQDPAAETVSDSEALAKGLTCLCRLSPHFVHSLPQPRRTRSWRAGIFLFASSLQRDRWQLPPNYRLP